jgi:4-hydroxy-3-polyprenylbenzoate decarboxylase
MTAGHVDTPERVIVAITGASGAIFGIRLLERLEEFKVERHLIVSAWGSRTIRHETDLTVKQASELADVVHKVGDLGATVSSGSFVTSGMIIAPCSAKTLAAIASGFAGDLVARAADVTLKERRRLVLMVRESPLNEIHLENMLKLARMGASIVPPMASFYTKPASLDEMIDHVITRVLDQFGLHSETTPRWDGSLD